MALFGKRKSPERADLAAAGTAGAGAGAPPSEAARADSPAVGSAVGLEALRASGAGPTAVSGLTDLHTIAARGTAADVQVCVEAGADVNAPNRVGYTPLSIAASRGDVDVARALLDAGAEVDSADRTGTTALAAAVLNSRGSGEMITLLLERGANPGRPNNRGQSPRELARRITSTDVARFFEFR